MGPGGGDGSCLGTWRQGPQRGQGPQPVADEFKVLGCDLAELVASQWKRSQRGRRGQWRITWGGGGWREWGWRGGGRGSVSLAGGIDRREGEEGCRETVEGEVEGHVLEGAVGQGWVVGLSLPLPLSNQLPHLPADGGSPGASLVLHGLPVHAHLQAPSQTAAPALVPVGLVHLAEGPSALLVLARVLPSPTDCPLEEPSTPIACKDSVVFAGAEVGTDLAGDVVKDPAGGGGHPHLLLLPLGALQSGHQHPHPQQVSLGLVSKLRPMERLIAAEVTANTIGPDWRQQDQLS